MINLGVDILVGLADRVTAPLRATERVIADASERMNRSLNLSVKLAGAGAAATATAWGIERAVSGFTDSIREVERAKGELATLGVHDLEAVVAKGQEMQARLAGVTADAFVRASYDIKSGISSLTDEGVAEMTASAMLVAKATKGVPEQMTSLFATSYGIFKDQYAQFSDADFGNLFGAALSASVQQFKTDGAKMQQAIESAGAGAVNLGMAMTEQLALLGMMQTQMQAGEAGTALRAFATNAAKAHEAFSDMSVSASRPVRVRVLDENGQLRAMPDILADLQARYGDTLDAFEAAELKEAFGTDEAMKLINALYGQEEAVRANAQALEEAAAQGEAFTLRMAQAADNNWDATMVLMSQKMDLLWQKIGERLLPVLDRLVPYIDAFIERTFDWIDANPGLVSGIGAVVIGIGAAAAALGPLLLGASALVSGWGLLSFGATRLGVSVLGLVNPLNIARTAMIALRTAFLFSGIGAAIAGVAMAGHWVYENWERVAVVFQGLGPVFSSAVSGVKALFQGDFTAAFDHGRAVVENFSQWWAGLDFAGKDTLNAMGEGMVAFYQAVSSSFAPAAESLHSAFAQISPLMEHLGSAFASLFALFSGGEKDQLGDNVSSVGAALGQLAGFGIEVLAKGVELLARGLETVFGVIASLLDGDMRGAMGELREFFDWLASGIILPEWLQEFSFGDVFAGLGDINLLSYFRGLFDFSWAEVLPDWNWASIIPDLPDFGALFGDKNQSLEVRLENRANAGWFSDWERGAELVAEYRAGLVSLQEMEAELRATVANDEGGFLGSLSRNGARAQEMLDILQELDQAEAAPQIHSPETLFQAAEAADLLQEKLPAISFAADEALASTESTLAKIGTFLASMDFTSEGARIAASLADGMRSQIALIHQAANDITLAMRPAFAGSAAAIPVSSGAHPVPNMAQIAAAGGTSQRAGHNITIAPQNTMNIQVSDQAELQAMMRREWTASEQRMAADQRRALHD